MGPLMNVEQPSCLRKCESNKIGSKYIKGASAVSAWHILRGERVVALSHPPPEKFHPSGRTNYQAIEKPILKSKKADGVILVFETIHPAVNGAEDFVYQFWSVDKTSTWMERFGSIV